jgi:PBP1b-binding outer membrane lipoprotein LpoB
MVKMRKFIVLVVLMLTFLVGCSADGTLTKNEKVGQDSYQIEMIKETDIELAKKQREKVLEDIRKHPELVEFATPVEL